MTECCIGVVEWENRGDGERSWFGLVDTLEESDYVTQLCTYIEEHGSRRASM
jgi:hypothetical protein